jgi:hypothetical protein
MQTEKNLVNQHGTMRQSQLEAKLNKDTETLRQDDSLRNLDEEHHSFFVCLFVYMSVLDRDERVVSRN